MLIFIYLYVFISKFNNILNNIIFKNHIFYVQIKVMLELYFKLLKE